MRGLWIGAAAVLLAGCGGGGEKYPVSSDAAYASLAGLSGSPAVSPLPDGLEDLTVNFEGLPSANAVRWSFNHRLGEIATVTATVAPNGKAASVVTIDYADGPAEGSWFINDVRTEIRDKLKQSIVEAVDSRLDNRAFDMALRDQVNAEIATDMSSRVAAGIGGAMQSAVDRQSKRIRQKAVGDHGPPQVNDPASATAPTTSLQKFQRN